MTGVDFFDVDHTLTRRSSGARFIALAMRRGILPRRLLFIIPWYSLTYRLGVFHLRKYAEGFASLRGISRATLEALAKESFEQHLRADLYEGGERIIREVQTSGRRVVLATSSIDFIVAPLAEHLRVDGLIATALEFADGVCTGRIAGPPMFRAEKKARVLEYLRQQGVAPGDCSFYSDSIYDLPLLEAVGRAVAVNPDLRLHRLALRRGWPLVKLS
jgi:HAD superfamily hydrolase (TIGR01490 family)